MFKCNKTKEVLLKIIKYFNGLKIKISLIEEKNELFKANVIEIWILMDLQKNETNFLWTIFFFFFGNFDFFLIST